MSIKTRIGNVVRVKNQDKKKSANTEYEAVLLKKNGQVNAFLFTDVEINVAFHRAAKNAEDTLERSLLSKILD